MFFPNKTNINTNKRFGDYRTFLNR